jgi:Na+/melibiose symporter-like transporter
MYAAITHGLYAFVGKGDGIMLMAFAAVNGVAVGAHWISDTVLADTIEYEELLTGRRVEGSFTMFSSFIPKIVAVPATVLPLAGLVVAGFVPSDDGEPQSQPDSVKIYLLFMFGIIPMILALFSFWFKYKYPIKTFEEVESIHEEIRKRKQGHPIIRDPLTNTELITLPEFTDE